MRLIFATLCLVTIASCDDDSGNNTMMDMSAIMHDLSMSASGDMVMTPSLTVDNTLSWCTVTVTIGSGTPATFTSSTMSFKAAAGTVVNLKADPLATFMPVKWTGVTTMSGDMATYTMTSAATQTVTACCAEMNGTGC
jgi:hypothetical protein